MSTKSVQTRPTITHGTRSQADRQGLCGLIEVNVLALKVQHGTSRHGKAANILYGQVVYLDPFTWFEDPVIDLTGHLSYTLRC